MTATTFWSKAMTVKLSNGNGSETVVRLSMQSVIALSTVFVIAIISGIVVWVYGLSSQVSAHSTNIAVLKQTDTSHREMLTDVNCKLDKVGVKLDEIKENQIRYMRKNGK